MKKLNYTEDLLRVIFFWIGIFFLVSGVLSFLGILKPAVNSGIQNPDMLGTVFSITGVLLCIISAALGIYTAKLDKLHFPSLYQDCLILTRRLPGMENWPSMEYSFSHQKHCSMNCTRKSLLSTIHGAL